MYLAIAVISFGFLVRKQTVEMVAFIVLETHIVNLIPFDLFKDYVGSMLAYLQWVLKGHYQVQRGGHAQVTFL